MKEIKISSFRYTKIFIEKISDLFTNLKINSNINLKDIEKGKSNSDSLKISFGFNIEYVDLCKIELEGSFILLADQKILKKILNEWKDKKLSEDINNIIFNIIMQKASLKALELEDELGVPPHIQLPKIQINKDN